MPRFTFKGRRESLVDMPSLNPRVKYSASYFDASVHEPERLALDVMADALATGNARVVTYAEAVGAADGYVLVRDALSQEIVRVTADVVVNASGPFTDVTNSALGNASNFLGGTKGSHIVVDHAQLFDELKGRELFFENNDGRIVLIYPVKGRVLIGTTDIFVDVSKPAVCTDEEVTYFFNLVKHILPGISLDRSQIVFRFSGIRPLPRQDEAHPGFVSRDYRIVQGTLPTSDETPLLSIVGGKWTTFRALGEQVSGQILDILSRERKVSTHGLEIGGGKNYPKTPRDRENWILTRGSLMSRVRLETLLERYGSRADDVIQSVLREGDHPLASLPGYSVPELEYLISVEKVVRLDDILLRRTSLAFAGELTNDRVNEIADIAANVLNWSSTRRTSEIDRVWQILRENHGVGRPIFVRE